MNARENSSTNRVVQAEYQDAQGYTHHEYKDAQGKIYTEYTDNEGILHSYKHGYVNGQLAEKRIKKAENDRAESKTSRGVLIGIILTSFGVLTLVTINLLTRPPTPETLPPVVNVETPTPSPSPQPTPAAEQPSVTVVPVPQPAPAQPSTVNVTANPSATSPAAPASPAPAATTPTASPSPPQATPAPATSIPTVTDNSLKTAILKEFKDNIPNNQLTVEVKNAAVTVSGTVPTQEALQQISPLLSSINGIKQATIKATVVP